jgi:hypothetical protein
VIKEVEDGEYIITTKQPYSRSHFFVEEELDQHETSSVGQTFVQPVDAPEEESKSQCVVQVLDDEGAVSQTKAEQQIEYLANVLANGKPVKAKKQGQTSLD